MRRNGRMLCFYIYMNMYMCIYIHIKQKFCALILGFSRSRERKLLLKWSLQNGLFSHSLVSKKASKVCGARCELFFYSFSYPSWLIGGHKLTKILLCTAFVNFYFPSEFCHLRCSVGKATVLCWLFSVVTEEEKKEKCEHGASYARHGNFCLLGSLCISVLNWNYQITASDCPRGFICYSNILPKTISASMLTEVCLFALVYF